MHLPINVKSPNNISKWQMGFNSPFKGLISLVGDDDDNDKNSDDWLQQEELVTAHRIGLRYLHLLS
jgi:hypothetical protein